FSLSGFSTLKREGIELTSGFTANVSAELKVGALEETVTVTGAAPLVDIQNTAARTVLPTELFRTLPVHTPSAVGFAAILPGAVIGGVTTSGAQDVGGSRGDNLADVIAIHGGRGSDQLYLVDGLRVNTGYATSGGFAPRLMFNPAGTQETTFDQGNAG